MATTSAILTAALLYTSGCGRGGDAAQMPQRPPPLVSVADVVVRDVPYYIEEIGRCASTQMVSLMPQIAGRVEAAHFEQGADVKKGDLLFTIDNRPFQAAVAQSEAALLQNRESLKLAQAEFARVEALKGTSAVSQTEFDQRQSAVAVAQAQVQAAQANLDTAKLNLEYCQIKSPIDGRTGLRLVDPGNVVKANESALVMVQTVDPIYADFTIPEDRLSEVRANMANGSLKTMVELAGESIAPGPTTKPAPAVGELKFLDNTVQAGSGTVRLRASVPNADRHFWPGQFVQIRLVLFEKKAATLVPNQAVQISQQGPYIYVLKHDDSKQMDFAELRPVAPGQKQGDLTVINTGLNAGEHVIVTGQMMVMPGAPVRVEVQAASGGAPQGAGAKS